MEDKSVPVENSLDGCLSSGDLTDLTTQTSYRQKAAGNVPFALRAWWLREFQESSDLHWHIDSAVTGPIWSLYSDPLCDLGGLDYSEDF